MTKFSHNLSVLFDEVEFVSAHKGKLQIEAITLNLTQQ